MIVFECPSCEARMQAQEEHAGKMTECPDCGKKTRIPGGEAIAAGDAPGAAASRSDAIAPSGGNSRQAPADDLDARRPRRRDESSGAGGAAAAGMGVGLIILIVLGIFGCISIGVVAIVIALIVPAVQKVRESAARTHATNNLKQIALALNNFNDANQRMAAPRHQPERPGLKSADLSWRVSILPFLEEKFLFDRFDRNEGFDSPRNQPLLSQPVQPGGRMFLYDDPMRGDPDKTRTIYQYFTGPKTLFPDQDRPPFRMNTIPDGASNTILVAQARDGVPWSKAADMVVGAGGLPLPADRFLLAMCDCSLRSMDRTKVGDATIRLAIDPADGQALPMDWDR